MSELKELYQQVILDHNKRPRNFRKLDNATHTLEGYNPLCGDRVTLYIEVEGDIIHDISFEGSGCAISRSSVSIMTESLKGKTLAEAEAMFEKMHRMLTTPPDQPADTEGLGKLSVFSGVREFPVRVKCASLAWHTLKAALEGKHEAVSTES